MRRETQEAMSELANGVWLFSGFLAKLCIDVIEHGFHLQKKSVEISDFMLDNR